MATFNITVGGIRGRKYTLTDAQKPGFIEKFILIEIMHNICQYFFDINKDVTIFYGVFNVALNVNDFISVCTCEYQNCKFSGAFIRRNSLKSFSAYFIWNSLISFKISGRLEEEEKLAT